MERANRTIAARRLPTVGSDTPAAGQAHRGHRREGRDVTILSIDQSLRRASRSSSNSNRAAHSPAITSFRRPGADQLRLLGRLEEAAIAYRRALELAPTDA